LKIKEKLLENVDWESVEPTEYKGQIGTSFWRTIESDDIRVRVIDYSADFQLDHFCNKGHIILVLKGRLHFELKNGKTITLDKGNSLLIGDGEVNAHRIYTEIETKIFIVD
jgi:quercetin dioxygenase-like cupin family protein